MGARDLTIKQQPDDVTVLSDIQLLRWLRRQKPVLDEGALARVKHAAGNTRFWHETADGVVDPAHMVAFQTLRAEDSQARRRRIGWMLLVFACVGTALALAGPSLVDILMQSFTGLFTAP